MALALPVPLPTFFCCLTKESENKLLASFFCKKKGNIGFTPAFPYEKQGYLRQLDFIMNQFLNLTGLFSDFIIEYNEFVSKVLWVNQT